MHSDHDLRPERRGSGWNDAAEWVRSSRRCGNPRRPLAVGCRSDMSGRGSRPTALELFDRGEMSIYLTKVLAQFALPLAWALLFGLAALLLVVLGGGARQAVWAIALQLGLLGLCDALDGRSAHGLVRGGIPARRVGADSGSGCGNRARWGGGRRRGPASGESLGRFQPGAARSAFVSAGKVRQVLAAGGNQPWLGGSVPEAEAMRRCSSLSGGCPRGCLHGDSEREHPGERAVCLRHRSARWRRLLLVTSAAHMERAAGAFRCGPRGYSVADGLRAMSSLGLWTFSIFCLMQGRWGRPARWCAR